MFFPGRAEGIGVTFDPNLFDRFPESLKLLSFGDGILAKLLDAVGDPAIAQETGRVLRCATVGDHEQRGYFAIREGHTAEVLTLASLRDALGAPSGIADLDRPRREALEKFLSDVRETWRRDREIENARKHGMRLALEEQGR